MLWWLLWSCSPQLTAPSASGSAVIFDTEAQAATWSWPKWWSKHQGTMFPHSISTGLRQVSIEFWTGFWTWHPWLHSAKEPAFGYKAVSKRAQPLDTAQKVSGSPVPRRGWAWSLCPACLGCWAWTFSTLSPRLADRGQREMLPLLTDQAEWKKESRKLLCLFSCLLPVKAFVGVQQWTCWSYGPVLPSLQCTKRALKIHISGFEELPCILQHKGNLPLWAAAGLYDCSLSLSESYPASDAETQGNKTV